MGGTGVIDRFLEVFTRYIDSGFGLLQGEVAFIATTLIVIDVTLAALFWSMGEGDDIIARLIKKTLFVGAFAYIIGNWNGLARIIFESFAGLGLKASGTGFTTAQLLQPGRVAQVGLDAGRPILDSIAGLMGYVSFFENFIQIVVLLFAWGVVLLAFFVLATASTSPNPPVMTATASWWHLTHAASLTCASRVRPLTKRPSLLSSPTTTAPRAAAAFRAWTAAT